LTVYSAGLGIPFFVAGLLFHQFLAFFKHFRKHIRLTEILTGVLLVVVGILLMSGKLGWLTMQIYQWLPVTA
jgi:cytochrome c-type biogenesis protein